MRGHKKENFYKLVRYPTNFKNTKRRTSDRSQKTCNGNKVPLVNNANYDDNSIASNYIAHNAHQADNCTTPAPGMTMHVFTLE